MIRALVVLATLTAMVLGTLAAGALYRRDFFGKESITLMLILPIALPGIVTGIALLSAFRMADINPNFWTIAIGHSAYEARCTVRHTRCESRARSRLVTSTAIIRSNAIAPTPTQNGWYSETNGTTASR